MNVLNCDPYDIFKQVSAREIFEFSCEVQLDKIRFIGQAAALNRALSNEGLRENYGLHIGRTLRKQVGSGLMSDDLLSKIRLKPPQPPMPAWVGLHCQR